MHVPPPRAGPQVPPLSGCSPSLSTGGDRASPHRPTAWGAEEPRPAGHPPPAPPPSLPPSLIPFWGDTSAFLRRLFLGALFLS